MQCNELLSVIYNLLVLLGLELALALECLSLVSHAVELATRQDLPDLVERQSLVLDQSLGERVQLTLVLLEQVRCTVHSVVEEAVVMCQL